MRTPRLTRRQWIAPLAGVLGVALAFATQRGLRDAFALSLGVLVLVVGASLASSCAWRRAHPVALRATVTMVALDLALASTFVFNSNTDYNLAIGAAMAIALLGLSFLTGVSGQISLGNGAFMGVGAFVFAIWANHHATTPVVATLLIAVAAGALVGFLIGLPATRLRGPYLAGMTLAFAVAFTSILSSFSSWTGGDSGLQLPSEVTAPRWFEGLLHSASPLTSSTLWTSDLTIVITGVAFFFMANLYTSRVGRGMRLVRDNDVAAELVGISLSRIRVVAFVVSAAYAALGGALWTLIDNAVSPSTFTLALSVTMLSLIVIGGVGTIPGALIGGLMYAYSTSAINWLSTQTGLNPQGNFASQLSGIIFGGLLIVVMLLAPFGIVGAAQHLWRRRREHTPT